MNPYVDMWRPAPVPDKGRSFQPPVIPDAVFPEIIAFIESEVAFIKATVFLECGNSFILIILAEWLDRKSEKKNEIYGKLFHLTDKNFTKICGMERS